jgi:hypothetical protein
VKFLKGTNQIYESTVLYPRLKILLCSYLREANYLLAHSGLSVSSESGYSMFSERALGNNLASRTADNSDHPFQRVFEKRETAFNEIDVKSSEKLHKPFAFVNAATTKSQTSDNPVTFSSS